jgi:zinc/manganese transport system substrate-binding protein
MDMRRAARRRAALLLSAAAPALALAGCGMSSGASPENGGGPIRVVAAEDFWGSIAAQLGGGHVTVQSIIRDPATDPHSYEPTAADGIAIARSQVAIVNGLGYDSWASKLLEANPSSSRAVLDVGSLLGLGEGANPHQWCSPASVRRVIAQISADYERLDPANAGYFARRRTAFETGALAEYDHLRAQIRARYAHVPVGYSESIFRPLGEDLGLTLLTPYSFAKAIAEGTDVSAADKQTVDRQVESHAIKVWIYNSQNSTPDVQRVSQLARAEGIPVAAVTETLTPPSATFEQWQVAQLRSLELALAMATGR